MPDPSQDKLHKQHDKLFKTVFSDPKEASSFFKSYLPTSLVDQIDWTSLHLTDKEYVDEAFQATESDLLYQAQRQGSNQRVMIYLLFEHQSEPSKWIRFRLLKYCCRIWDDSFKAFAEQQKLKPILPIVFYQGERTWNFSTEFQKLIETEGLDREYLPRFSHFLVDQSGFGLESFQGEVKARIAQLLLSQAFHGQIRKGLEMLISLLEEVEKTGGIDYIQVFLRYFWHIQEEVSPETLAQAIEEYSDSQHLGEQTMSIAEQLIAQGEKKGIQEGIQTGIQKGLDQGELVGEIRFAQKMLKKPQSPKEELFQKTEEALKNLLEQLEKQLPE